MTNGTFDTTQCVEFNKTLNAKPVNEEVNVRYTDIFKTGTKYQYVVNVRPSNYNCDYITQYVGTLNLPLDEYTINIDNTNDFTVTALSQQLGGFSEIKIKNNLKIADEIRENVNVQYNQIQNKTLNLNILASRFDYYAIKEYLGALHLPLDEYTINIDNTNNFSVTAASQQLGGFDKINIQNNLNISDHLTDNVEISYNEIVGNSFTKNASAASFGVYAMKEYIGTFRLPLNSKTITVDENSETTITATNDQLCGYTSVTIRARGSSNPDTAPSVVYPIPISTFGVYTISPLYCLPSATKCRSMTFTFSNLSAAIAAGGAIGLLPQLTPCIDTITENGVYDYDPNEYPIPNPTQNVAYSSAKITVNVPNQTTTLTATSNTTYTPESPYIGYSSVTVNVPQLQIQSTKYTTIDSFTSYDNTSNAWQYINITPSSGYDGITNAYITLKPVLCANNVLQTITENGTFEIKTTTMDCMKKATVTVNVPAANPQLTTLTATTNSVFVPQSPYVGFSSVDVQVDPITYTLIQSIPNYISSTPNQVPSLTYNPDNGTDGFNMVVINRKCITSQSKSRNAGKWIINNLDDPDSRSIMIIPTIYQNCDNFLSQVTITETAVKIQSSKYYTIQNYFSTTSDSRMLGIQKDDGYDGMEILYISQSAITKQNKTITSNGTYNPSNDGLDCYGTITVNVSSNKINLYSIYIRNTNYIFSDSSIIWMRNGSSNNRNQTIISGRSYVFISFLDNSAYMKIETLNVYGSDQTYHTIPPYGYWYWWSNSNASYDYIELRDNNNQTIIQTSPITITPNGTNSNPKKYYTTNTFRSSFFNFPTLNWMDAA